METAIAVNMHDKKVWFLATGIFLGFETQQTVRRLAKQHMGTSSSCPKRSYLAIHGRISAVNVWPTHFQHSGQPDAKTAEAFILQLEGEYH